jgi:hypothetical protein
MSGVVNQGSQAFFQVNVFDKTQSPPALADPAFGVTITITNSLGTGIVAGAQMAKQSTGIYTYALQTTLGDPKGLWLAQYKALGAGPTTNLTPPGGQVFQVI